MNPIIAQMLGYSVIFILTVFFLNFLSSGFLFRFIRVKASRGMLILVEVEGLTNATYRIGKIDGNMLKFKSPAKKKKTILISRKDVIRKLGVNSITVDDETNAVRKADYSVAEELDAEQYDNLLVRAITAPHLEDNAQKIIMIVGIVLTLAGLLYIAWNLNAIKELINVMTGRLGGQI